MRALLRGLKACPSTKYDIQLLDFVINKFLPHASMVLILPFLIVFFHFVCEVNISGTAKRIYAKFTGKTCLVSRSDKFECQGQRSKVKVSRDKNALCAPITPATTEWNALAVNKVTHQQIGPFHPFRDGVISAACMLSMFGKTSLAPVMKLFQTCRHKYCKRLKGMFLALYWKLRYIKLTEKVLTKLA